MPLRAVFKATGMTLLLLIGGVIPFLGVLLLLLAPLPLAILVVREKQTAAIPALAVIGLLFASIGGVWVGTAVVAWFFALGVLTGLCIKSGMPFRGVVARAAGAAIVLVLAWAILYDAVGGVDVYGDAVGALTSAFGAQSPLLQELLSDQALEQIQESLPGIVDQLPYLLPTIIVAVLLASAMAVAAGVLRIFEKEIDLQSRRIPPFVLWRVPWYMSWGFVLSLAAVTVPSVLDVGESTAVLFEGLGNGGLLVLGPFYLVQGAAIVSFYIKKRSSSHVLLGAILAVMLFVPLISQAALFLGLFDTWFDIRRLEKGKEESNSQEDSAEGS